MKNKIFFYLIFLLILVSSILMSCRKPEPEWKGTMEEVDGVTVVKNPIEPRNPEMKIIFEEDLTIGVEEGDDNYMFGREVFINTDDAGNVYVTDWDKSIVNKYDQDGVYLHSIGGRGQGPGEFQNIGDVGIDAEGKIYLYDKSNKRISFLNKEGKYLQGIKVISLFENLIINSKGFYVGHISDRVEVEKVRSWDYVYGLFDDKFTLVEEFFRIPTGFRMPTGRDEDSIVEYLSGGLSVMAFRPFVTYVLDEKENIIFGYSEDYEIKVYNPNGKLSKRIQREHEPITINNEHKKAFLEKQGESFMDAMPAHMHSLKEKVFRLVKYPKIKPAYERFSLMENGWIFVVVDSAKEEHKLVDIFNENGEYLAQFETDIATDGLMFNNGKAYAVATQDDYKFIKRYKFEILGYKDN